MSSEPWVATARAAMDANMIAFFAAYGAAQGCTLLDHNGNTMFYTGVPHPLFNGAISVRDVPGDILAFNDRLEIEIRRHKAPALWWVGSGAQNASIGRRLSALGLDPLGPTPAMGCDITPIAAEPLPDGLRIEEARTREARVEWARLAGRGTGFAKAAADALAEVEGRIPDDALSAQWRFTGILNGEPVATAALVGTGSVAGIYAVATMPEARRFGIATAMTRYALRLAAGAGLTVGVLQSSDAGRGIYGALGFREVFDYELYRPS